ncbi:hypothetical protein BN938_2360 [Mucinivorans hirudinis]|uniref:Uncharacterized protein n=1 Tax=Mucinivorans hirudinis TaxID=1433126 RepID=A0A060R9X6_9BACT|nr:hypothetical protein BN938_2360 [Mucinivorans hirudinis]
MVQQASNQPKSLQDYPYKYYPRIATVAENRTDEIFLTVWLIKDF